MAFFGGSGHAIQHAIEHWGYAAVAGGILLENFGLPLPGETLLISGAIAAAAGTLDLATLLVLAWLAAVAGNSIGWALGHYGGHALVVRHGARFGITAARLERVERAFDRYGDTIILIARFIVLLRQLSGIAAGTLEMGWLRFLILNAAGAALWVLWWGLASYFFGARVWDFVAGAGRIEPLLIAAAALALLWLAVHVYRRTRG